ncbi:MAG: hypothetical protein K2H30_03730 [Clostridia bacterium]|nr:hypothetical protein [Clostridia bacterium]
MENTKEQVLTFLEKCEELRKCKFIMATTKIKDLLKCIVNSPELYRLFDGVTKDFDYLQEKARCLIVADDGYINKSKVVLPQTVGHRLAFIFCLLVEFDRDTLNFNEFLQVYYPEDGSYFASYMAFCNTVIVSLEELIQEVFNEVIESNDEDYERKITANPSRSKLYSEISLAIEAEKHYLCRTSVPKEEKEGGCKMLNELLFAVKSGNENLIDALICGYNYFVLYNGCVSDGIASLIDMLAEFEAVL